MTTPVTRRAVLAGIVAVPCLPSLVGCRPGTVAPGRTEKEEGTLSSRYWPDQDVRWRLAKPARGAEDAGPQPLVVALHGHGSDADWPFTSPQIDRYVVQTGLAVATIDGGDFYWHARRSGIDTGRMITEDLLPLLRGKGLATERIGLIGWSMGGYGALLMASRLGPRRVAGVVAVSAALWQSPEDSADGAFDDRADFIRNDVFAAPARRVLRAMPVRLDCGRDDAFIVANRAFARELPDATAAFDEGGHTGDYWRAHAGAQMSWLQQQFR